MIDATTLLEVSTLGRFEVRRDHVPLSGGNWSRRKVNDLFKLLLSAEQHRLHREQIQEVLWPNSTRWRDLHGISSPARAGGKVTPVCRQD